MMRRFRLPSFPSASGDPSLWTFGRDREGSACGRGDRLASPIRIGAKSVLLPLALHTRAGQRCHALNAIGDSAAAMIIVWRRDGTFSQELHALQLTASEAPRYSGERWELFSQDAGGGHIAHYLGVPDSWFREGGPAIKSLSIQIVGHSPLRGPQEFVGGMDVHLEAPPALAPVAAFRHRLEDWFPTVLPEEFVTASEEAEIHLDDQTIALLAVTLRKIDSPEKPPAFDPAWEARDWVGCRVEGLEETPGRYRVIQGGCFIGPEGRFSHWFGTRPGPERTDFRKEWGKAIRAAVNLPLPGWVFWTEMHFLPMKIERSLPARRFDRPSFRESSWHQVLQATEAAPHAGKAGEAGEAYRSGLRLLKRMAHLSWKWAGLLESQTWAAYQSSGSRFAGGSAEAAGEEELKAFLVEAESTLAAYPQTEAATALGSKALRRLADSAAQAMGKTVAP